ncbi:NAD/NADP octopine/nopaline dehydrogenase family protein [Nakamurella lactea]|uniref:NAD/NADP octopine/nopaline dehydrogenase family protein n=1 Tax=Nakamurella lactea TaxID=459515 RepID=UPI0003FCF041|nr:NAD/NADP octopine/nopaline dehydrogenase family protein [Nakamurella lactea]
MSTLPDTVLILGSGAGALSCANEFAQAGIDVVVSDLPQFPANVDAIAESGVVRLKSPWQGITESPARADRDPAAAIRRSAIIVVCVPAFGHDTFAALLAEHAQDGTQVIFAGEGGGCLALGAALAGSGREVDLAMAELNSLPYGTRVRAPGLVTASRKSGGTLVAGIPSVDNPAVETALRLWPTVSPVQNVLETILLNFNAIDHVPPILCNLGAIDAGPGKFLLWGSGASPAVCRIIGGIDSELVDIRRSLGFTELRGYEEFLVAQGFAPKVLGDLHATLQSSTFADSTFGTGPHALESRYVTEDVPFALCLMSSIGQEIGVPTPTIDAVIQLASVATGTDFRAEGRSLATFGLAGRGRDGLLAATDDGWWNSR